MSDTVLKVEGLYKKFTRDLKRSMLYGTSDMLRSMAGLKPNNKLRKSEFWALQDINFELKRGETLGIIGANGSGKSTLLRVINGIFPPDKGLIEVKGRIGALIAVGAGFHPHMTGRENIYLNGTLLGMSKAEIKKKFDEIVDFAEIGDFLEAPVATYSSGMRVRLGFAIAVNINPDVLLVDEVLAVGDASFQKKSAEKLNEMQQNVSVIFISHNMRHIYRICDKVIWLNKGINNASGTPDEIVNSYLNHNIVKQEKDTKILHKSNFISDITIGFFNSNNIKTDTFFYSENIKFKLSIKSFEVIQKVFCAILICSTDGTIITILNTEKTLFELKKGNTELELNIPRIKLTPGNYFIKSKLSFNIGGLILEFDSKEFLVKDSEGIRLPNYGFYREEGNWKIN